jgi:hypothetical protein
LKFKYQWKSWNDRLNLRFPYLTTITSASSPWGSAIQEGQIGATDLQWETSAKLNLGIDMRLFNNKIDLVTDFFHTETTGIFQKRANIPDETGLTNVLPYTNIGGMKSWGVDGTLHKNTNSKRYVFNSSGK